MQIRTLTRAVAAIAACLPLAAAAADDPPLTGVWRGHEYTFAYSGFTSHYSCDGIAGTLKQLLLAAGARDDLKVRGSCSDERGGPSRVAVARATFHTLAPDTADPAAAAATEPVVRAPGAWKVVEFKQRSPAWLEAGDCELVEQFERELLPLFATRNLQSHMACVPNQYQLAAISLRFEVFAPLPTPRPRRVAVP